MDVDRQPLMRFAKYVNAEKDEGRTPRLATIRQSYALEVKRSVARSLDMAQGDEWAEKHTSPGSYAGQILGVSLWVVPDERQEQDMVFEYGQDSDQ